MAFVKGTSGLRTGRPPTELTAKQLDLVTRLAARGVRELDIARACVISRATWFRLKERQPEVQDAIDRGRQVMHDALVGKLYEEAMRGNTVANLFLLKVVFGYRENEAPREARPQIVFQMPEPRSVESYRPPVLTLPAPPARKEVSRG